jgi:hypothetical protein
MKMESINVDPTLSAQLGQFHAGVKICDNNGQVVGYFTPASGLKDQRPIQMPQSDEELQRRLRETSGRPLKDILDDLEKQR